MRTFLVLAACLMLLAADASAQRRNQPPGPGPRGGEAMDLRICGDNEALCVAAALIRYIGEKADNPVRYGVLISHMYNECRRFDDAKCAARFIQRAHDQARARRELETERFRISPARCNGGQCSMAQETADFLCQDLGYDYAVSSEAYSRRRNLRECGWGGGGWQCDDRCRTCGNGIEWITCGR